MPLPKGASAPRHPRSATALFGAQWDLAVERLTPLADPYDDADRRAVRCNTVSQNCFASGLMKSLRRTSRMAGEAAIQEAGKEAKPSSRTLGRLGLELGGGSFGTEAG